jgi:phospholipid-binding lipoprotein MlaA
LAILLAQAFLAPPAGSEQPPALEAAPARELAAEAEDSLDLPHISSEAPLDDDLLLEDEWLYEESPDPLEAPNRAIFCLNESVYRWLLDPVADVYGFVMPDPVRESVRRFFSNLREPANLVNELIQLRARRAGTTGARFLVNSTVGIGGLFDPASRIGLERYATDFGQTLALYGVPEGPYLVVPLMGPANLRDALGNIVDALMRPDVWLLATGPQLVFVTSDGITGYESRRIHLDELRANSFDFYVALRSAYRMDREAQIEELRSEREELRQALAERPQWRDEVNLGPYRVAPRRSSPRWRLLASRNPRASRATSSPSDAVQAR